MVPAGRVPSVYRGTRAGCDSRTGKGMAIANTKGAIAMSKEPLGDQIIARVSNPEHRARLEAMQLDPRLVDEYIQRSLPGGRTEAEVYDRALMYGKPVLLVGPAGSGKTFSPLAYAAERRLPVAILEGHAGFDPEVIFAARNQNPETGIWEWDDTAVGIVLRYGGLALVDEVGRIPSKPQGALLPVFDWRRRVSMPSKEIVKIADDALIVATTNPPSYAGVSEMDPALMDRFSPVLEWDYSDEVEARLLKSVSLRKMAKEMRDRGELETPVSTRILVEFETLTEDLGIDFAGAAMVARFADYEQMIVQSVLKNWLPRIQEEIA